MTGRILVTGATGNLGGAAARSSLAAGLTVRVASTDLDRLRAAFPDTERVRLDLTQPETFPAALAGVTEIFLPAGAGRVAFVDTRDLGDVAAGILADPHPHRGAGDLLTGAEPLTFDAVAALLTGELGRRIRYRPATVAGYLRHLHRQAVPPSQALVQTLLHTGLRRGQAARVDPTLARLLGRVPRSLAQYIHDHRSRWEPARKEQPR